MQIITAWYCSSPELNDFKKHCISSAVDETDDMLHNGCVGDRSVQETNPLTVKMETVTLTGKGR